MDEQIIKRAAYHAKKCMQYAKKKHAKQKPAKVAKEPKQPKPRVRKRREPKPIVPKPPRVETGDPDQKLPKPPYIRDRILQHLTVNGPATYQQIAEALWITPEQACDACRRMKSMGRIIHVARLGESHIALYGVPKTP